MKKKLLLASNSPRRKELLASLGISFEIRPSAFEEVGEGEDAAQTATRFAEGKAKEVFSRYPDCIVLGADTVVSVDGRRLGKPRNEEDAKEMLRLLSGREHSVYTGMCLLGEGIFKSGVVETKVFFYPLSEEKIEEYLKSGSPMDKAGAYGIQDGGLVEKFEGSYSNVVGLPVEELCKWLAEMEETEYKC